MQKTVFACSFGGRDNQCEPFTYSYSSEKFTPWSKPKDIMADLLTKYKGFIIDFDELFIIGDSGANLVWSAANDGYEPVGGKNE